ncbi:monoheme cytochrome C [Cellulophaga sp. HaHaR_3_176]|uniref:monoheme cytochrome C n=1 Tax=Cellulophaga sp. HaHaR_3_176 TaxID=1942464 RepID=UPI001C1FA742|nr:monoheme cytochrome C [Cellulophaga sp. HaHaR_3_176]QWX84927.1 monoheme cytochrome C [Cellulophaga sp. HaHaR_3_176]
MSFDEKFRQTVKEFHKLLVILLVSFVIIIGILLYKINYPSKNTTKEVSTSDYVVVPDSDDYNKVENGIHLRTGFVEGEGLMQVVNNCTNCHSAKLVTQNRMSKEKWLATIRWMQETQNLWDLGESEEPILTYLSTYYAPDQKGRRGNLKNVEWYVLEN